MKHQSFKVSLILMGFSGIIGQIVLLRELLVSFYGNEITLGIILANWLIIEAAGSFWIGKSVERTLKKREIYGLLQLIFSVAFPIALTLARTFKNIIVTVPGEGLGFGAIFGSSFLILLPVSLSHGALFTYGCRLYSEVSREGASSVGKVYILETIGTLLGGLLVTFLLVRFLNPFQIVFIISLINAVMTLILLWPEDRPRSFTLRNGLWGVSLVLTLLFCLLLIPPASRDIHETLIRSQWRETDVVHNENSVYGNITVTKKGEQVTFFTDGIPSITTPVPDMSSLEDRVHFPMLFHEKPETILILHGGAGGMISEILKYPVTRIDYVELDPLLLKMVRTYSTPLTQFELSDRRVRIHDEDGRFFIRKTPSRYDVILIGLSAPHELQSNRLFTSEFFSMAAKKMTRDGVIALTLPGSLTYISPELKDMNGCILDTLRSVFRQVRVIPGDINLYLASNSDRLENVTAKEVIERFRERQIKASLFTPGYIESRLHDRWVQWFDQSMEIRKTRINSDYRPLAVFFSLSHWNALFSPYLAGTFKGFEQLSFKLTVPAILLSHIPHRSDVIKMAPPVTARCHVRRLHLRMDRDDLRTGHHFYLPDPLRLPLSPDRPPHRRFHGRHCRGQSLHHPLSGQNQSGYPFIPENRGRSCSFLHHPPLSVFHPCSSSRKTCSLRLSLCDLPGRILDLRWPHRGPVSPRRPHLSPQISPGKFGWTHGRAALRSRPLRRLFWGSVWRNSLSAHPGSQGFLLHRGHH